MVQLLERFQVPTSTLRLKPEDRGAAVANPGPRVDVTCSFLEGRDDINFTFLREHNTDFNCKV